MNLLQINIDGLSKLKFVVILRYNKMFNENLWSLQKEYKKILSDKDNLENDRVVEHLVANLPFLWSEKYRAQSKRITDICRIQNGSFEYIFDDYSTMEKRGIVHKNQLVESRLVAVYGTASAN